MLHKQYLQASAVTEHDRTVDRDTEGLVVRREIEFLVSVPSEQPILGSLVIVIIVAGEHFILSHGSFPFCRRTPGKRAWGRSIADWPGQVVGSSDLFHDPYLPSEF